MHIRLTDEDLFDIMSNHFKDDSKKVGKNNLKLIIEDFIEGGKGNVNFESPTGGHNYDLVASMSLIVGILQLIVASADYISQRLNKGEKPTHQTIISYIFLNFPDEPIKKLNKNNELLEDITKIIKKKINENPK